jgi:two-component system sensor kinase FixL
MTLGNYLASIHCPLPERDPTLQPVDDLSAATGRGLAGPEEELRALLDAAVDAIIVIDSRGHIETFSNAAERIFGYSAEEILGKNVNLLMPEPDRSAHDGYLRRYELTGEARIIGIGRDVQARRRDGTLFPASLAVGRISGAEPPRFVGFIRDISERVAAEQAAAQAQERLAHVARLSTMGEMAAGLAHEINQPLAAITTYAQACQRMLDKGEAPDAVDIREALVEIGRQALRAGEVIRRLRGFVANRAVRPELIGCNRLLEDTVSLARPDLRANDVRLRMDVAPNLPDVIADAVQLQQVLINLIRNAIDATLQGGPAQHEIRLRARCTAAGVEISVHDHGPGLDPATVANLFNPFFTTKPHGTGLGLAISRTIVQAHSGTLAYREEPGGGACFFFTLPALCGDAS